MSAYELEVLQPSAPGTVVVGLAGELDLTNARAFEERLEQSVEPGSRLVVDLDRVVFIDSAALHVLFRLSRRLGQGRFAIRYGPNARVARALEIVGVADAMTVETSADGPPVAR